MKESGLDRALRYFFRYTQQYMLCVIAGSFAMSVYIWLINGFEVSFSEVLDTVPSAVVFISMIVLFCSGLSSAQYWYTIPVSFGCRRRNAFWGNLSMDLLFIAESAAFYMLMIRILQTDVFNFSITVLLPFYLALAGISKLFAIAALKWGKGTYVVMMTVIVTVSILCGFLVGFSNVQGEVMPRLIVDIFSRPVWKISGFSAGTAIFAAANLAGYQILKKFEVKA